MDCREVEKIIPLYLDGEFSDSDTKELEDHINNCVRCKNILQEEKELKQALASIKIKRTPSFLREKIQNRLDLMDRKSTVFSFFKISFVTASTVMAIVSTFMLVNFYKQNDSTVVNKTVASSKVKYHMSRAVNTYDIDFDEEIIPATYSPTVSFVSYKNNNSNLKPTRNYGISPKIMENLLIKHYSGVFLSSKRRQINNLNRWIRKNLQKINNLPSFKNLNATFKGAAQTTFNNQNAIHIKYLIDNKPVTLLMFSPQKNAMFTRINSLKELKQIKTENYLNKTPGGRTVAVFIHKNLGFSIVSELKSKQIQQMIKDLIISY